MARDFMNPGPPGPRPSRPRVGVIGAGVCGLLALEALAKRNGHVEGFEMGSGVGGLWVFGNDNGRGGAYRSLRSNTSTKMMEFSSLRWPENVADYPRHDEVADYFRAFARKHDLERLVRFRTRVEEARPLDDGGYEVVARHLDDGGVVRARYDALVVANGHHAVPSFPTPFPAGEFHGRILHAHDYVDPATPLDLGGREVVVVGFGNSAVDIASELAKSGARTTLSVRRGVWVIPKFLRGRPIDQGTIVPRWLPAKLRRRLVTKGFELVFGKMRDVGLPDPDHRIGEAHPTLSDDLPGLVRAGQIRVAPPIGRFDASDVIFEDGTRQRADAVIFCTGYRVEFPFFDPAHVAAPANRLPLFHRVFHPTRPHVFFVGLAQPIGAILPIAELQAEWIASYLDGSYHLPDAEMLEREIERQERAVRERFVTSPRHTMQIDPDRYVAEVRREMKRGQRRAARGEGRAFSIGASSAETTA